jgi:hypothetical protein
MLQPYNAIVTVCAAHCVREAQTAPMYALRVKPMLGRRRLRGALRQCVIRMEDHNPVIESNFLCDDSCGKLCKAFIDPEYYPVGIFS